MQRLGTDGPGRGMCDHLFVRVASLTDVGPLHIGRAFGNPLVLAPGL